MVPDGSIRRSDVRLDHFLLMTVVLHLLFTPLQINSMIQLCFTTPFVQSNSSVGNLHAHPLAITVVDNQLVPKSYGTAFWLCMYTYSNLYSRTPPENTLEVERGYVAILVATLVAIFVSTLNHNPRAPDHTYQAVQTQYPAGTPPTVQQAPPSCSVTTSPSSATNV